MNTLQIIPVIIIVTTAVYRFFVLKYFGQQDSYSRTWYNWQKKSESRLFTVYTWILGLSVLALVAYNFKNMPALTNVFFILASASIMFVGIASNYKQDEPKKKLGEAKLTHYVFSGTAIGCGLLGLVFAGLYWPAIVFLLLLLTSLVQPLHNRVWWIEEFGLITISSGLWLYLG